MEPQMEFRVVADAWPTADFEVRAVGDGMEFAGYAAVFDSPSELLGTFRETIAPGAFTRSINAARNGSADIRMFWNHNQNRPLGSTKANLRLSEDSVGLVAEGMLPNTTDGRDMSTLVREKIVRSMSFGFSVPYKRGDGSKAVDWNADKTSRLLRDVTLYEVSPVTGWPAYKATTASVRHLLSPIDWDDEDAVREAAGMLTPSQRDLWLRHLMPTPTPSMTPTVAELRARLERKRVA